MNILRSVTRLRDKLGKKRFKFLVSSDNIGWVCQQVDIEMARRSGEIQSPTKFIDLHAETFTLKIGDRIYEFLNLLKLGEVYIPGPLMEERAKEMNAYLGEEDAKYILDNQKDIPVEFCGKIHLIFLGWDVPVDSKSISSKLVARLSWHGWIWVQNNQSFYNSWMKESVLVRRIK